MNGSYNSGVMIEGNTIGLETGGTTALLNNEAGVLQEGSNGTTIGGTTALSGTSSRATWGLASTSAMAPIHSSRETTSAPTLLGRWRWRTTSGSSSRARRTRRSGAPSRGRATFFRATSKMVSTVLSWARWGSSSRETSSAWTSRGFIRYRMAATASRSPGRSTVRSGVPLRPLPT